jgi:hypothetical protein
MRRSRRFIIGLILLALLGLGGYYAWRLYNRTLSGSNNYIHRWFTDPGSHPQLATVQNRVPCPSAPFILPSDGLIGLLWDDPAGPYSIMNPHTGIDIFGHGAPGTVPVYAAYDGYLTRLQEWFSAVIIRHDDPLQPGRKIWTYYTHLGNRSGTTSFIRPEFPRGTSEKWVTQGTLLGYQGEYAGSGAPIGMHLHFSIVYSDAAGKFTNETQLANTLDPSPYLGMALNFDQQPPRPLHCS